MKVRDFVGKTQGLKVIVSWEFNKGAELQDITEEYDYILDREVKWISKTELYDLVLHI